MKKFEFKIEEDRSILEFTGSAGDAAKGVAMLAHAFYSAYLKDSPTLADAFQELVKIHLVDEASLVWTAAELEEGDSEVVKTTYGEDESCEG